MNYNSYISQNKLLTLLCQASFDELEIIDKRGRQVNVLWRGQKLLIESDGEDILCTRVDKRQDMKLNDPILAEIVKNTLQRDYDKGKAVWVGEQNALREARELDIQIPVNHPMVFKKGVGYLCFVHAVRQSVSRSWDFTEANQRMSEDPTDFTILIPIRQVTCVKCAPEDNPWPNGRWQY